MVYFYDKYFEDIIKVSRRERDRIYDWAPDYGDINTYEDARKVVALYNYSDHHNERYHCVNLTNNGTVEIRCMRGTLKYDSFMACLDFVYKIAMNAKKIAEDELDNLSLWLKGIKNNTKNYLTERNAFVGAF